MEQLNSMSLQAVLVKATSFEQGITLKIACWNVQVQTHQGENLLEDKFINYLQKNAFCWLLNMDSAFAKLCLKWSRNARYSDKCQNNLK